MTPRRTQKNPRKRKEVNPSLARVRRSVLAAGLHRRWRDCTRS
ncbi:MAG: hypothetical protein AVDCRST_MAG73-807 [uncultured Thermomicrobiales bacterium]|uniref:Uncharacterized protein n=1 Tax=uncultured Thermomicrobiales bacterium TaxID=1645740 RepID=A0A6J4TS51_9BACT|nr:MAG: hypothetical protein AVDCRST_MAG73-807 [uncultured Thermomicrobiales bacterium]